MRASQFYIDRQGLLENLQGTRVKVNALPNVVLQLKVAKARKRRVMVRYMQVCPDHTSSRVVAGILRAHCQRKEATREEGALMTQVVSRAGEKKSW